MVTLEGLGKGFLAKSFQIIDNGKLVTAVNIPWSKISAYFNLDGNQYEILPEGWFAKRFILKRDSVVFATAKRKSLFRREIKLCVGEREISLMPLGWLSWKFNLIEHNNIIGQISTSNLFMNKYSATFPDDLPLHVKVSLFSLVFLIWKQVAVSTVAAST